MYQNFINATYLLHRVSLNISKSQKVTKNVVIMHFSLVIEPEVNFL